MENTKQDPTNLLLSASFVKAQRKADKSVSLHFITSREITSEEFGYIDSKLGDDGWLNFKPNKVQSEEMPDEDTESARKTPSQRLRGVLFRVWQTTDRSKSFDDWYKFEMERIINHYKAKLN